MQAMPLVPALREAKKKGDRNAPLYYLSQKDRK